MNAEKFGCYVGDSLHLVPKLDQRLPLGEGKAGLKGRPWAEAEEQLLGRNGPDRTPSVIRVREGIQGQPVARAWRCKFQGVSDTFEALDDAERGWLRQ